jgi:DNA-binding transcriptional MerR regulator
MTETLSIGQVAERTGLSVHALRFYEREGLFADQVQRGPAGRRVCTEDDVHWLTICTRFRASGMPLNVIREYVRLVREGAGNEEDRLELLKAHQRRIREQIEELNACLEVIGCKVQIYEDHVARGTAGQLWT